MIIIHAIHPEAGWTEAKSKEGTKTKKTTTTKTKKKEEE
jgi:hypothetical protein